ncbi:hypothetical protein [Actinophytocola sp.]|uniref:hypothetical protein n=1 Tax=Actinophytocola sp. TaxID=1872138 RepID=UPI0025BC0999|nr:hypothetical protein [Actinophytocola sp.]
MHTQRHRFSIACAALDPVPTTPFAASCCVDNQVAGCVAGPRLENARQLWNRLDRPGWDRFGLTVTPDTNILWYDQPDGEHRWACSTPTPHVGYWTKADPAQRR